MHPVMSLFMHQTPLVEANSDGTVGASLRTYAGCGSRIGLIRDRFLQGCGKAWKDLK